MKRGLIILGAVFVISVGGFVLCCFRGFLPAQHKPSFNAEIAVDLIVDGEKVEIRRIVECKTITLSQGSLKNVLTKRAPTAHAPTVGAIGKRLKGGAAIMMWTPYRCAHKEIEKSFWGVERRVVPNEPGYIPFMGWTPNADTVDTLELYPATSYFKKPNARVKLINLTVRNAPRRARPEPPDEFEWFTQQIIRGENRKTGSSFFGTNALILEKSEWSGRFPDLDALLARQTSLWMFPNGAVDGGFRPRDLVEEYFREIYGVHGSLSPSPAIPNQKRFTRRPEEKEAIRSPVTNQNAIGYALVTHRDEQGVTTFSQRSERSFTRLYKRRTPREGKARSSEIRIGTKVLPRQHTGLIFEPVRQEIYWVFLVGISGHPRSK